MADFAHQSLAGSTFTDVSLRGARIRNSDLRDLVVTGCWLTNVDVSGEIESFRVNGVDVVPLVEAELNRRYPERAAMQPSDAEGFRTAWAILERLWSETVERARALPPERLHESVGGEWSFVQTLRHLVFATDCWVRRALLRVAEPWHPLGLPHDDMDEFPNVPADRDARPSLEEVLAIRADRQAAVRAVLADLTDQRLASRTEPVEGPGYPEPDAYPVVEVLRTILNEEWEHRRYAERDLDALAAG